MIQFSTQGYRETEFHRGLCAILKLRASVLNLRLSLWALVLFNLNSFSQKTLALNYYGIFGKEKRFEFYTNAKFTYKLKGQLFYHTKKLTNMQDSILVFDDEFVIKLSEIKAIRIRGIRLSAIFFRAGTLFVLIDTFNGLINQRPEVFDQRALIVAGAFYAGALVTRCLENKHVRIRKNTTLRIIDADYQKLNSK